MWIRNVGMAICLALVAACQPAIPIKPSQPGAEPALPAPPGPAQATIRLEGEAWLGSAPLAGATVTVRSARELTPLVPAVATDAQGRFAVALSPQQADDLLVITAASNGAEIYAYTLGPAAGMRGQSSPPPLRVDLSSTIVAKRFLPALVELVLSTPANASFPAAAWVDTLAPIRRTVSATLAPPIDVKVASLLTAAESRPDEASLEALTDAVITTDALRPITEATIEQIHRALITNFQQGGALFTPGPWKAGYWSLPVPHLQQSGDAVVISYRSSSISLTAVRRLAPLPALVTETHRLLRNLIPLAASGGSSSGSSEPATADTTILTGSVKGN